jgi:hypothetical protein
VAGLAIARQHQKKRPAFMERAVEGGQAAYPEFGFSAASSKCHVPTEKEKAAGM